MDPIGKLLLIQFITARKQSLRRLCFYTCLSVHRGEYLGRYPPGTRYTPGRYTPPGSGTPPWDQVTPPDQVHPPQPPPGTRYTPPGIRYTPTGPGTPNPQWDQVHPDWDQVQSTGTRYIQSPMGPGTPPPPREQCVLGDTGNKRALRILLKCILVF